MVHIMSVEMQSLSRPQRRVHSRAFKRKLVELSLVPGASVSAIALEQGINANLLFGWRRAHLRLREDAPLARSSGSSPATLLSVEVVTAGPAPTTLAPARAASPAGSIEIEVAGARLRVRGAVDEASLRSVLAALRR